MVNATGAAGTPHEDRTQGRRAERDIDGLASVFANFRQYLMGWDARSRPGSVADQFRSGLAAPQFNGVVRVRSAAAVGQAVAAARTELAGLPWWWWVGPDSPEGTADGLQRHGAREFAVLPVMVRSLGHSAGPDDRLDTAGSDDAPVGLTVETVGDGERLAELVRTYRTSMGIAAGLEPEMVRIESRREDNADIVRLAAVLDGRVVGSTVVITAHGVAGIFLVHVAEAHRRRGIGAAMTVAALRVGRERGMRSAALVASPAGEPLYRRFGFTTRAEYRLFAFPA
ncbi:GNAT family N-acetyltransferase [Streptomyces sp. NPDC090075]|uniref:GNAT family N-acetyltransferase n=1 Tax=Streptomyces sp. NPDC090075 TaxID=3365937 RepID=UPI003805F068